MKSLKWYSLRRKILVYWSWDFSHNALKYTLFHSLEFNISKAEYEPGRLVKGTPLLLNNKEVAKLIDSPNFPQATLSWLPRMSFPGYCWFSLCVCVCVCLCAHMYLLIILKLLISGLLEQSTLFWGAWCLNWDCLSTPDVNWRKIQGRRLPIFPNEMRQNKWKRIARLVQRTKSVHY